MKLIGSLYAAMTMLCLVHVVKPFLCKSGSSLGKVMQPDNTLNCIGALIERCSVVYTNNNGNEIWVHGCASSSNKCGSTVVDGKQFQNYCCCETENCNDAEFAERCSSGKRNVSHYVSDGKQFQNYSCCEKENCNDAEFAERCSSGRKNVVSVVLLLLVAMVVRFLTDC